MLYYNYMKKKEQIFREIMFQILRVMKQWNILEKQARDFGTGENLYTSEIHLIESIGKNRNLNVTELANRLGVTKGAVSQIIGKLEKKGYIIKTKAANNDKEVILQLTETGWVAFAGHEKAHQKIFEAFVENIADLSEEQLNFFKDKLDIFENSMTIFKYKE